MYSDNFLNNPSEDIFDTALLSGSEFVRFLQLILNKSDALNLHTIQNLKVITRHFIVETTKLKTVYITGRYDADKKFVSKINEVIRKTRSLNLRLNITRFQKENIRNNTIEIKNLYTKLLSLYKTFTQLVSIINEHIIINPANIYNTSVLIGTLRNSKQLTTAVNNNFYHIPKILVEHPEDVKCIALYQSRNLFDINCGIRYYGRVIGYRELPRHEIKQIPSESDEIYVVFEIEKWKVLKKPIKSDYMGSPCIFTSLYRFINSKNASEMTLNNEEYILYRFMNKFAFTKNAGCISYKNGDAEYNGEYFQIKKSGETIYKMTNNRYSSNAVSAVKAITAMLD